MNQPPLNPDAQRECVELLLEYRGTPMHRLYEYPHRDNDSDRYIANAKSLLAKILAVAQPVVNSVEELDQLPVGSLIMMSGVVAPFLHTDDGWESTRTPGKPVWDYTTNPSYLPARVLYRPTKESTNGR